MLRTVLLPVDFANGTDLILRFAEGLPALGVKRVMLCTVVEQSGIEAPVVASKVDEARERLAAAAGALEAAGLAVESRVTCGHPQDDILALACELQVDAIVAGSHARGVVDNLFLGSIAEHIIRESPVPTLCARYELLRGVEDQSILSRRFASKLLVPTDFSSTAARAFIAALELPHETIGTMFIMHAVDPAMPEEKRRIAEQGASFELDNLVEMAKERGINASGVLSRSGPEHAILSEIDSRRITGVVVGTRGRTPLQAALLGSVSMTMLRQASCPVMVVS